MFKPQLRQLKIKIKTLTKRGPATMSDPNWNLLQYLIQIIDHSTAQYTPGHIQHDSNANMIPELFTARESLGNLQQCRLVQFTKTWHGLTLSFYSW